MRKFLRGLIVFLLAVVIVPGAWGATYYVKNGGSDAADGLSDGNAWATIKKVVRFGNIVTNSDFAADTNWTKGDGWTISGGVADCDGSQESGSSLSQNCGVSFTTEYEIFIKTASVSAGTLTPRVGNSWGSAISTNGLHRQVITSASSSWLALYASADFVGQVEYVFLRVPVPVATVINFAADSSWDASDPLERLYLLQWAGSSGNEITFQKYGEGADPLIYIANDTLDSWTVDGSDYYSTQASSQPYHVVFNNVALAEVATQGELATGKFWWDSGNSRVYVRDDPSAATVKAYPTEGSPIQLEGCSYITLIDIQTKGGNVGDNGNTEEGPGIFFNYGNDHITCNGVSTYENVGGGILINGGSNYAFVGVTADQTYYPEFTNKGDHFCIRENADDSPGENITLTNCNIGSSSYNPGRWGLAVIAVDGLTITNTAIYGGVDMEPNTDNTVTNVSIDSDSSIHSQAGHQTLVLSGDGATKVVSNVALDGTTLVGAPGTDYLLQAQHLSGTNSISDLPLIGTGSEEFAMRLDYITEGTTTVSGVTSTNTNGGLSLKMNDSSLVIKQNYFKGIDAPGTGNEYSAVYIDGGTTELYWNAFRLFSYGLKIYGATGAAIVNAYNNSWYSLADYAVLPDLNDDVTLTLQDNIISGVAAGKYFMYVNTAAGLNVITSTNNCWSGAGSNNWRDLELGVNTAVLATWQAAGYDANSINTDPLLTDPGNGDLSLQAASPCRNTGDNSVWSGTPDITDYAGAVITDGLGNVIDNLDIGAYQTNLPIVVADISLDTLIDALTITVRFRVFPKTKWWFF